MHFLVFLLVGLFAGWLVLVSGRGLGLLGNLIVGIICAFLGGIIFRAIGLNTFDLIGEVIQATVGSAALLGIISSFRDPLR